MTSWILWLPCNVPLLTVLFLSGLCKVVSAAAGSLICQYVPLSSALSNVSYFTGTTSPLSSPLFNLTLLLFIFRIRKSNFCLKGDFSSLFKSDCNAKYLPFKIYL